MTRSKLAFFLIVLMLFTVGAFIAGLAAQDTEQNSSNVQEFVKMAQEHVKKNQIEEAIEIYERIVIAAPDDLESRSQLAKLYTRTKKHKKAAQTWGKLLEDAPENIKYQDELFKSLHAAGKVDEALELAQAYVQMYPEVGVHYARLAKLYDAEGNAAASLENYKKATVFGYGDKEIYLRLAEHYFLNDDITASEAALKNAITYTEEWYQEEIERQLLNLYRYQGNLEEMLQKAEAEGTITYEMQKERARLFLNTGELEKFADAFKKALEMTNSPYERNQATEELLKAYVKHDRKDLALEFYEAETAKQTRLVTHITSYGMSGITVTFVGDGARKALINAYKDKGELEELATIFKGKLEKNANNPAVLEILAEIYWETNNYQKAAEVYDMLSKVEPRNIRSFYYAAAAFHKSNQPDMVKAILDQTDTKLTSIKDTSLIGALATICLKSKMYDPAIKLADAAVTKEKNRDNSWGLAYYYVILAKSYQGAKRYKDAFEAYQQVVEVDKDNYLSGRAATEMKQIAKDGKLYEKWIPEQLKQVTENPNDPERISKLAESYEATDKIKEAVAQYERLAELEPEKSQWHKKLGNLYQNLPQENPETGTPSETLSPEQFAKSIAAFERAIELEPTSYQSYDLLAKSHIKSDRASDAEKVYRRALDAPLSMSNHNSAIRAISELYAGEGQENKRITILEEIRQKLTKMEESVVLHELLGDLYKKVGDPEKTELANAKWLKIRLKEVNKQSAYYQRRFAEELLNKGLFPETALKLAKRAFHKNTYSGYDYPATLGRACVANGLYDEALRHFKHALSLISDEHYTDMLWEDIAETIKNANDKERFFQMLNALVNSIPSTNSNARVNVYRIIAQFYSENGMPEKAEKHLLKSGFIPENQWITLGPFRNIDSRGVLYAYIPEETTQIDTTAKYYGRDKLISWEKPSDNKLDGLFDFGNDEGINNDSAAYAWAIVISPDERDVVMRFDSDDQGTVWLNGKQAFSHDRTSGSRIDRYTVPVTLKQGENSILVKVCNAWQTWDFYMRLTDADQNVFADLKFKNADALLNAPPPKPTLHVNVNLGLAEYYSKNNMPDKAMEQMQQTGMIHENLWLTLGPYDNTAGIGYNTKYIPEDTTQINLTAKYQGVDGQINWKKFTDDAFDGFIDLGRNVNWCVSYAWVTVTSPDERKVQLRFGSDDQAKMWLNGKEVFAYPQYRWVAVDGDIIPVTLKAGKNTILVKVCNEEMSWGFYLRITDADGKPFEDLKINEEQDN